MKKFRQHESQFIQTQPFLIQPTPKQTKFFFPYWQIGFMAELSKIFPAMFGGQKSHFYAASRVDQPLHWWPQLN